ncbi:MAG: polyphosphate kinase 1 [Desulfuromonadales bacterium]|nr:polyphosphate kinase 1 [Desulfuromonadales bacterium]
MMPFINRELSWLSFNERVLAEAARPEILQLDRLKFLAITASNLDEFFMVRVAYLNDCKKNGPPDDSGLTSNEQLEKVLERTSLFQLGQITCLSEILKNLHGKGISFLKIEDLTELQLNYIRKYFEAEILPVITPLAIDPSRPFPFLANLSLNIGVRMQDEDKKSVYAVIQVPSILPRFILLPSESGRHFLPLEELITHYLHDICDLYRIIAYGCFRITRSADFDADEDTDNLLEEMKRTIKKRKRGRPIRLELSVDFDEKMKIFLRDMLRIPKKFIFELPGLLDLAALMKMTTLDGYDNLRLAPIVPALGEDFEGSEDIFALIRERDRMLHHPYESFDHVVAFIKAAAADPDVLAIKQTLYRVSGHSKIVAALEQAAEAGKQVTVLVELKARFDEENNIQWATRLERAGCNVIYGLTGLKTHCKVSLVVRREEDGIRRYLHLSTGNYNDTTARLYTDIGMFTCRPAFGADASALFNHLTGFSMPPQYNKLVVAPEHMKKFFLDRIEQEIQNARSGLPCGISFKNNSLLDSHIIHKLYEASEAGVNVQLLIRGICSLMPGVEGISENIRVRSIVGRFLEHSRIFVFENAGDPQVFLGSADLMPRNLDRRVEVVFPVEDPMLKNRLYKVLKLMWHDNVCAWELGADSEYRRVEKSGKPINSQLKLLQQNN